MTVLFFTVHLLCEFCCCQLIFNNIQMVVSLYYDVFILSYSPQGINIKTVHKDVVLNRFWVSTWCHTICHQGPVSISDKTSYRKISWSYSYWANFLCSVIFRFSALSKHTFCYWISRLYLASSLELFHVLYFELQSYIDINIRCICSCLLQPKELVNAFFVYQTPFTD